MDFAKKGAATLRGVFKSTARLISEELRPLFERGLGDAIDRIG
jgi:hypothetical protein